MDQVMLIGRLNETTRELFEQLAFICAPQLCADSKPVIEGMLELLRPGVVVVALEGSDADPVDLFYLLESAGCRPAVVAIGSVEIQGRLIKERYLPSKRVIFLQSPVKPEEVSACVKGFLTADDSPAGGRKKILVVDDDPATLRTVCKMLSKRWNVSAVISGSEAITAISRSRPDLILLDYDMPVLNGKMVFEILRGEPGTKDIPVVFLTGLSDMARVEEVLNLHPAGYLLKPPSEEKLIGKLESVLSGQISEQFL